MAKALSYAVLGRGRWAAKMRAVLEGEGRRVVCIKDTRTEAAGLLDALRASGAQAAWLCVTPGPHVRAMVKAAIEAGVHVVAEKPWMCSAAETKMLAAVAVERGVRLGVHFEYCLLDGVEAWRSRFHGISGLRFGGRFTISRPDRLGIPAMENLGSHVAAIRRYAAPQSELAELVCAYGAADERRVWIEHESIDFLENQEPIIQRFVRRFEDTASEFPFDLGFALRVAQDLARYRDRQIAGSREP
jgi:Oxidoreductase family, NAD-binding Rossmann fold